jgi:hypothetical protein
MAGADRETNNASTNANISDYRRAGHQTANGLDDRYGAGQVNILNSYQIIAGGEHNIGDLGCAGTVLCAGFDYDNAFGGANNSNNTAEYFFSTQAGFDWLFSAALVWNIDINAANDDVTGSATLHNLDLQLIDLSAGNTIVGSSTSTVDNTENLWLPLQADHNYALKVLAQGPAFEWDYALAWRLSGVSATTVPLPGGVWLLGSALSVLLSRRRRR